MRTEYGNRILEIIAGHTGENEAISAPKIAAELGWTPGRERDVRRIISTESILWDIEVVEKPGVGFFVPETYDEVEKYIHWLDDMADSAAVRAARKRDYFQKRGLVIARHAKEVAC